MARIAVFCASSERIDPRYWDLATRTGTELAARGHDLVSGGGRVSMMGAVAQAVRAGDGHTLGVIPQVLVGQEVADTDANDLVVTVDMRERKGRMEAAADAFLALPGGLGTLEELLEIWVAATLGMHNKPVVVLDPEGAFAGLRSLVDDLVRQGFIRPASASVVRWSRDVTEALDAIDADLRDRAEAVGPGVVPEELLESEP